MISSKEKISLEENLENTKGSTASKDVFMEDFAKGAANGDCSFKNNFNYLTFLRHL